MTERYRLSFTTGGLLLKEAPVVARCYLTLRSWPRTRDRVRGDNLLQARTAAAATRVGGEVISRLQHLDEPELQALIEASLRDQAGLMWAAACRRYAFLREFATEVLREHHLLMRRKLTVGDYDNFYNRKALWHPELDEIAPSTQRKLRQNLFRMLREADLISAQNMIQPPLFSPHLALLLASRGPQEFLVFPATDSEIQRWLP